jgi:hypothetical protein
MSDEPKPTKTLEQLVAENPGSQFEHSDYAPWVKLANDPKVPPRARQYYQELIDGDRRHSALDRWKKALKHPSLEAGDKQYIQDQIDLLAQSAAGKHSADVVETVRRILAKLRR